ncbi:MAG: hypothetical protein RL095_613 [Verrucomicrobiota bacterium]|jgi:ethanolamine ammonia-lyase small subunit
MTPDPWHHLRQHTAARIALGHAGVSLPTRASLAFRLAHAQARDAVHSELEAERLVRELAAFDSPSIRVRSQARGRDEYLKNPGSGRRLSDDDARRLQAQSSPCDLCIVIGDGLSACAVNQHALPLIRLLAPEFQRLRWSLAPIILAEQCRVALSDDIGSSLQAEMVLMLIGERPGLSSPDSMGAYLTWRPAPGLTDERRNCVSNIRSAGLALPLAASKLLYLLGEMKTLKLSGVELKDRQDEALTAAEPAPGLLRDHSGR